MAKKDTVEEEVVVSETEVVEDAPHKALREVMANYEKQNPVKFAAKKLEFERKLGGKLAFGMAPDGSLYDGHATENGKRVPIEIVVVK